MRKLAFAVIFAALWTIPAQAQVLSAGQGTCASGANGINNQSAAYGVVASDKCKLITGTNSSASFAYTLPQAGSTGFDKTFAVCFRNETAVSTDPTNAANLYGINILATTSTLDGVAGATGVWIDASQSTCIWTDGANYFTSGIQGVRANLQLFNVAGGVDTAGTWTKPHNITFVQPKLAGGGGGGAAGISGAATDGSGGGGGGDWEEPIFNAADLGATEKTQVGAAGIAGIVGGAAAGTGGTSCFGGPVTACTNPLIQAFGGGPGNTGGAGAGGGGGPGGYNGAGAIGTTTVGAAGGGASVVAGAGWSSGGGGNGGTTLGGSGTFSTGRAGGGGAGGNGNNAGGNGAIALGCTTNRTGSSGVTSGTASQGQSPTNLSTNNSLPGCGGAGGGGATTGTGGAGGVGAICGGGGGAGGSSTVSGVGGAGGLAGAGCMSVKSW